MVILLYHQAVVINREVTIPKACSHMKRRKLESSVAFRPVLSCSLQMERQGTGICIAREKYKKIISKSIIQ